MKIAVNLTFLMDGKQPDGIGQFALNLFRGIQAIGRLNQDIHLYIFSEFEEKCSKLFPEARIIPVADMNDFSHLNKYHRFLKSMSIDRLNVPYYLGRNRYDLLFHPFNIVNAYVSSSVKTVITLHDLFFKNMPELISPRYLKYVQYRYKGLIYKTNHIVTPSNFVKKDIIKYYPEVNPNKISVINNPIWVNVEKVAEIPIAKPYILCVNSIRNHKNLITLLKAFKLIEDQVEHYLVLSGFKGEGVKAEFEQAAGQLNKLIRTDYVPDDVRNYLYLNADLFVSPSLHEGFGMTPVEAAIFGTPVLTTFETSIPEITRGLVNYYAPATDEKILADKILELLHNKPSKDKLSAIKNKLTQEYEMNKIAMQYLELFDRLIRG